MKGLLGDRSGYSRDINNPDTVKKEEPTENQNIIKLNNKTINGEGLDFLIKTDPGFNEKEYIFIPRWVYVGIRNRELWFA